MTATATHAKTRMLLLTALFAALTAIGAFLKIPTPWSSFTLQVFFVCMAGVLLGPKYGALSQLVYIALGLMGLPIFTTGGGLGYVFQPTFGFLLSYIPACAAGLAVIYLVGLPYMGLILNVYLGKDMGVAAILWAGMLPFLPWDVVKIAATVVLAGVLVPRMKEMK